MTRVGSSAPPASPSTTIGTDSRVASGWKSAVTLLLLLPALPVNLSVTGLALLRGLVVPYARQTAAEPKTVLISGGKMTKALQLARSFAAAGHRVVLVESAKYRLTGHRFSRAVDRFYVVPAPDDKGYAAALLDIVVREQVDVYVPVCSPVSSRYDALAKAALAPHCEVLHGDAETIAMVDDKVRFAEAATALGLGVPDSYRITDPEQVLAFDFAARPGPYIIKSIPYDPVSRLDLTLLPRPTSAETAAFLTGKPISVEHPWVLQAFASGQEYCAHATVRDGQLRAYVCCPSSPWQLNYTHVDVPEIEAWVERFVGELRLTGQYSFDLIHGEDGEVSAIECNPRTHSAITAFGDDPNLARAYLDPSVPGPDAPAVRPAPDSRPVYWIYHELWRLLTQRNRSQRLATILIGRDAVFAWSDPLPFLMLHHMHIPSLLLQHLVRSQDWVRIDFAIGKLVEPAGD